MRLIASQFPQMRQQHRFNELCIEILNQSRYFAVAESDQEMIFVVVIFTADDPRIASRFARDTIILGGKIQKLESDAAPRHDLRETGEQPYQGFKIVRS